MIIYPGLIFLRLFYFTLGLIFERPQNARVALGSILGRANFTIEFLGPIYGPGGPLGRADLYLRSFGGVS